LRRWIYHHWPFFLLCWFLLGFSSRGRSRLKAKWSPLIAQRRQRGNRRNLSILFCQNWLQRRGGSHLRRNRMHLHRGDWRSRPQCLQNLSQYMSFFNWRRVQVPLKLRHCNAVRLSYEHWRGKWEADIYLQDIEACATFPAEVKRRRRRFHTWVRRETSEDLLRWRRGSSVFLFFIWCRWELRFHITWLFLRPRCADIWHVCLTVDTALPGDRI
jgi:hypothetical protein